MARGDKPNLLSSLIFWSAVLFLVAAIGMAVPEKETKTEKKEHIPITSGIVLEKEYKPAHYSSSAVSFGNSFKFSGKRRIREAYCIDILYFYHSKGELCAASRRLKISQKEYEKIEKGDFYVGR